MRGSCDISQCCLTSVLQDLDALAHIPHVQGIVEAPHDVIAHLSNLQHLAQLLHIACMRHSLPDTSMLGVAVGKDDHKDFAWNALSHLLLPASTAAMRCSQQSACLWQCHCMVKQDQTQVSVRGRQQSLQVWRTCHEVQEGQPLKVLGLLVAELHNLMVALPQGLYAQPVPGVLVINLLQGQHTGFYTLNIKTVRSTAKDMLLLWVLSA